METFYKPPLETQECLNQFIVPVFKEVQRINYLPSSQSCAPFQSHADCDKSPNSKGGESYDWNYGWNSCCSGFCPSKRECANLIQKSAILAMIFRQRSFFKNRMGCQCA